MESIKKERQLKEWVIVSDTEYPATLNDVAILTNEKEIRLDKLVGENFRLDVTGNDSIPGEFIRALRVIIIAELEDVLVLLHEAGHGIAEDKDPILKALREKILMIQDRRENGENIDKKEFDEIIRLSVTRAERTASAYALKKIRELKNKKGIDLVPGKRVELFTRIKEAIESNRVVIKDVSEYKARLKIALENLQK